MKLPPKKFQFSEKIIAGIKVTGFEAKYFSDTIVPKLKLCAYPNGQKSFLLETGFDASKQRIKIGQHGKLSASEARKLAKKFQAKELLNNDRTIALGSYQDPYRKVCLLTVSEFLDIYRKDREKDWTAKNLKRFDQFRRLYITPYFGPMFLDELRAIDVLDAFNKITSESPISANTMKAYLQTALDRASLWGYLPAGYINPCHSVKNNPYTRKGRALNSTEIQRMQYIAKDVCHGKPDVFNLIKLLLLTGCRYNEIATLEWENCFHESFHLPRTKTGPRTVSYSSAVKGILDLQRGRRKNQYVFPAPRKPNAHIGPIYLYWSRIREQMELPSLRIHDLRHTFATQAILSGVSVGYVSQILGHKNPAVTEIYIHSLIDVVKKPSEEITNFLVQKMGIEKLLPVNTMFLSEEEKHSELIRAQKRQNIYDQIHHPGDPEPIRIPLKWLPIPLKPLPRILPRKRN